jgi:VIT1/CCC1 family predicted Fe2+/Mn2+ transporter
MSAAPHGSGFGRALIDRIRHVASPRSWAVDANDGVMATAGLLEGFAGAGANDAVLLTAASAMLIAGSLSIAGAKWSEAAAERDAERALIAEEEAELAADPIRELEELTTYWEGKGLEPDTARQVAEQLNARDALAAQLEYEHGIVEPAPAWQPRWIGATAGLAFLLGAAVPLLVTALVPGPLETWAIVAAAVLSLSLTAWITARSARTPVRRILMRSLGVAVGTLAISYVAGLLLL